MIPKLVAGAECRSATRAHGRPLAARACACGRKNPRVRGVLASALHASKLFRRDQTLLLGSPVLDVAATRVCPARSATQTDNEYGDPLRVRALCMCVVRCVVAVASEWVGSACGRPSCADCRAVGVRVGGGWQSGVCGGGVAVCGATRALFESPGRVADHTSCRGEVIGPGGFARWADARERLCPGGKNWKLARAAQG